MRTLVLVTTILFTLPFCAVSQDTTSVSEEDTLRKIFPQKLGKWNWAPLFGFDARRSWMSGQAIKISGVRIGATYKGIHRFGGGYYWMKRDAEYEDIEVDEPNAAVDALVKFDTRFIAAFYERVVYRSSRWNISIPLMFSFGSIRGYYETIDGEFPKFIEHPYSAMTTGLHSKLYLMTWLVPRFHFGYRFTFNTTKEVKKAFDRFYLAWGVSVSPWDLKRRIESQKAAGRSIFDPRPL